MPPVEGVEDIFAGECRSGTGEEKVRVFSGLTESVRARMREREGLMKREEGRAFVELLGEISCILANLSRPLAEGGCV